MTPEERADEAWVYLTHLSRSDWTQEQNFKAAVRGALIAQAMEVREQYCLQEMFGALKQMIECSPCQNGCKKTDMTCATRRAEAVIAKVSEFV